MMQVFYNKKMKHAVLYRYLTAAICCCLLQLGAACGLEAATTEDYIRALQPRTSSQAQVRGFGGTVAVPAAGQQPAVDIPLHFSRNSAELLPRAREKLTQLARALDDASLRSYKFIIEGHTCDLGSNALNMELSKQRAFSVTRFLSRNSSLSPNQFTVQWYGEERPAEPNVDEAARQRNRRVVIKNTLQTLDVPLNGKKAELQIFQVENGEKRIVPDGARLKSGTQYSIAFKSAVEPYVYVCQLDAGGQAVLLFPNQDISTRHNPIVPGESYQVPESGVFFYLDNVTGTEQFILLTHQTEVQNPTLACATAVKDDGEASQTRGVGGVRNVLPTATPAAIGVSNLRLCEIMCEGATRGVGGVASGSIEPGQTAAAGGEASCQGFFLKRYFLHE
jgi:outer membrane protein OmpA-like peptidoglycan-associated protein